MPTSRHATLGDLWFQVENRIERQDPLIYDVLAETGQMFDNVRHMRWFRYAVAQAMIGNVKRYAHLELD